MTRTYRELPCGCLVSEDGGGGLIPCYYPEIGQRETDLHNICMDKYFRNRDTTRATPPYRTGKEDFKRFVIIEVKVCKYPDCVNYNKEATHYCCNGCSYDDYDRVRSLIEDLEYIIERL